MCLDLEIKDESWAMNPVAPEGWSNKQRSAVKATILSRPQELWGIWLPWVQPAGQTPPPDSPAEKKRPQPSPCLSQVRRKSPPATRALWRLLSTWNPCGYPAAAVRALAAPGPGSPDRAFSLLSKAIPQCPLMAAGGSDPAQLGWTFPSCFFSLAGMLLVRWVTLHSSPFGATCWSPGSWALAGKKQKRLAVVEENWISMLQPWESLLQPLTPRRLNNSVLLAVLSSWILNVPGNSSATFVGNLVLCFTSLIVNNWNLGDTFWRVFPHCIPKLFINSNYFFQQSGSSARWHPMKVHLWSYFLLGTGLCIWSFLNFLSTIYPAYYNSSKWQYCSLSMSATTPLWYCAWIC